MLGPMIGVKLAERVEGLIKDAVAKGAKLMAGGQREGAIMAATVLDFVTPEMRIYSEESFGPVASVVRVKTVEDAIRVANDTEYGLSSAGFGRDVNRALAVARRIEFSASATLTDRPSRTRRKLRSAALRQATATSMD